MDRCKDCGANLALVGARHNCVRRVPEKSAAISKPGPSARIEGGASPEEGSEAYRRYRDKEGRKAYMREYMRKRRALTKT